MPVTEPSVATEETLPPESARPLPPAPRGRRRRLANVRNVRLALADVFHQLELGQLSASEARARVYTLQVLAAVIQGAELETRLAALEAGAAPGRAA